MPRTWLTGNKPIPGDQLSAHFWSKVDRNGPLPPDAPTMGACWIWKDFRQDGGYGLFNVHRRRIYAHRFAYQDTFGDIPEGLHVLHNCHNGKFGCVRPSHLKLGTAKDNIQDALARGSYHRAECRNGHVYSEVGVYAYGRKRQCKACKLIKRGTQLCEGTNFTKPIGLPCKRKVSRGSKFCQSHRPAAQQ